MAGMVKYERKQWVLVIRFCAFMKGRHQWERGKQSWNLGIHCWNHYFPRTSRGWITQHREFAFLAPARTIPETCHLFLSIYQQVWIRTDSAMKSRQFPVLHLCLHMLERIHVRAKCTCNSYTFVKTVIAKPCPLFSSRQLDTARILWSSWLYWTSAWAFMR